MAAFVATMEVRPLRRSLSLYSSEQGFAVDALSTPTTLRPTEFGAVGSICSPVRSR